MSKQDPRNERLEQCRCYRVVYTIIGRGNQPVTEIEACVIAFDVSDVVDQIRKDCLGVEITGTGPNGEFFHEVVENIVIDSVELVGCLHGITDKAYDVIVRCDQQERAEEPPTVEE